jgi:glyoxylase-like metal-dependent hydrolase (beta-lactamase superfamily II)
MAPALTALTSAVHLVQGRAVNWLLVTAGPATSGTGAAGPATSGTGPGTSGTGPATENTGDGVMLIDAGYPGDRDDVLASLRELGFGPEDVTAILLTHAHVDHFGSAIWFAKAHGTPVYCHANEVGHAKREYSEQASILDVAANLWRPSWLAWTTHVVRNGGLTREGIPTAQALTADVAATLPGRPRAIPTPGHTGGHCSYIVDGVLASGDALVTGHPVASRSGPQLLPALFSHNQADTERSLAALGMLETQLLAPGHGPLWRGDIRDAVAQAAAV